MGQYGDAASAMDVSAIIRL